MTALDPMSDKAFELQYNFIISGEGGMVLDMLTKNKFLADADETTKRSAYLTVLKLCKFLLTVIGNGMACELDHTHIEAIENYDSHAVSVLKQALHTVPNQTTEFMLRNVASKLSQFLSMRHIVKTRSGTDKCLQLFKQALSWQLPTIGTIRAIIRLAWAASTGNLNNINASPEVLHAIHETNQKEQKNPDNNDVLGDYLDNYT